MSKNERAESTYQPQHPRCPLCERELWPLMDQERLPDGRLAHTYCLLRQKRNQPDGSGARKGEG